MRSGTILVIDDALFMLKLLATVLRNAGHKVQLATSAEEGLGILNTLQPDLILVDLRLPGMDGLEFTRHLRGQPRWQHLAVVAMTASSQPEIRQEALDAGCNGFISKPVEPKALTAQIQSFLEGGKEPEQPGVTEPGIAPGRFSLSGPETESLRRAFLEEALRDSQSLIAGLGPQFDTGRAKGLLYRWIGTAGLLGYDAISREALAMESLVAVTPLDTEPLRERLTNMFYALKEAADAANTPLPSALVGELTSLRVALVGFGDLEADRLSGALERVGARPQLFAIGEHPDSDSINGCDLAMVHARPENMQSSWLTGDVSGLAVPLILVGARDHLMALDAAVQSRATEFLIDGWQPEEALMRLRFALPSFRSAKPVAPPTVASPEEEPAEPSAEAAPHSDGEDRREVKRREVLIVDDDHNIRALLQAVLGNLGMRCWMASTGAEALKLMAEHQPRAVVLDVNMPGMDGFELLTEFRRQKAPPRVLMLTSRQQEHDIIRGFQLGADDYVVKPFNPRELGMRVRRLL